MYFLVRNRDYSSFKYCYFYLIAIETYLTNSNNYK